MPGLLRTLWKNRGRRRVLLNAEGSTPTQLLLPRGRGYVAYWVFDVDGDAVHALVVDLTPAEARRVRRRDPFREGFLEPVRRTLHDPLATVVVDRPDLPGGTVAMQVEIPRDVDEDAFLAHLDSAAQQAPRIVDLPALARPRVDDVVQAVHATENVITEGRPLALA